MSKQHNYELSILWTGNKGTGTSAYAAYERSHTVQTTNKIEIPCSSDPSFRGDSTKYNPEELLVASLSACHMLTYLHQCAIAGIVVTAYTDKATGLMEETPEGGGRFLEVTLNPVVTITDATMKDQAMMFHQKAEELCFIANSVNFPVRHRPVVETIR